MTAYSRDAADVRFKLPRSLVKELRRAVPRADRNRVVARAVERELRRLALLSTLTELAHEPAWTATAHPDLKTGNDIDKYVDGLRASWSPVITG